MFKIEKGVSVSPASHGVRGERACKYPWREMKAGDSFFVPFVKGKTASWLQSNLFTAGAQFKKNNNPSWKFATRVDHDAGGIRVWRIK